MIWAFCLRPNTKSIIELQNAVKNMNKSELSRNNQSKIDKLIKEKEAEIKKRKQDIFYTHQCLLNQGILMKS